MLSQFYHIVLLSLTMEQLLIKTISEKINQNVIPHIQTTQTIMTLKMQYLCTFIITTRPKARTISRQWVCFGQIMEYSKYKKREVKENMLN